MDNQRLLTWALFGMMAWLTYQAWMLDYGPQPTQTPAGAPAATQEPLMEAPDDVLPELTATDVDAPAVQPSLEAAPPVDGVALAPTIHVQTDVFDIELSTQGGTVQRAVLRNYPVAKDRPDDLVELVAAQVVPTVRRRQQLRIVFQDLMLEPAEFG